MTDLLQMAQRYVDGCAGNLQFSAIKIYFNFYRGY